MELVSTIQRIGVAVSCALAFSFPATASESAVDCGSASKTLSAGLKAQPNDVLMLFLDALRTNPGCRRKLLITGLQFSKEDPLLMQKVIFIARQEFPADQTMFAEAALETSPEHMDLIRDAFMTNSEAMETALSEADKATGLVELPPEARALDDDLREAIARMTAKVEGKYWPEQEVAKEDFSFKRRDEVRVSRASYGADETSLENAVPVDMEDERKITTSQLRINDHWEKEMKLRLDESKFEKQSQGESRGMREARKREIAPAGAVGFPERPYLKRSTYYIPPAKGDYRSTIDFNDQKRPGLIIRPPSAFRSIPATEDEIK